MDNQIYGLTKGQVSPTSPFADMTLSSMYGSIDGPLNPVSLLLNYGATFIARGFAGDVKHLAGMIVQAVQHRGFAFVHILSPCVTYRGKEEHGRIRDAAVYLDESYDYTDKFKAFGVSEEVGRISLGLIYKTDRPTYTDRLSQLREKAKQTGTYRVEEIVEHFLP